MFIRSERLFLRPGWPEDWAELLEGIADEGVVRNLAKVPWPYTAEDARWFAGQAQDPRFPHFLITVPGRLAPAKVVGVIDLHRGEGGAELGYWIGREHWGKGYATEAGRAVLHLARTLGHRRIGAYHFLDNPASGRVLRKLGFRPRGEVTARPSLARGGSALAAGLVLDLDDPSDCEDDATRAMRAA